MVLQRGLPVPVWGWADAGEKVSVSFAGQTKTANAGDDGNHVKEGGQIHKILPENHFGWSGME